ncbi:MAG: glycosyltransferase family 4 protein, partial [Flavobacteriaceae bacterium]
DLAPYKGLVSFKDVGDSWGLGFLRSYFEKCDSVYIATFPSNKWKETYAVSKKIMDHIRQIGPDYLHFDEFSARQLFMFPLLMAHRKKLIQNVHDPKLHSGEADMVRSIFRKVLFRMISKYVVFSNFSRDQLRQILPGNKEVFVSKLPLYTVYREFSKKDTSQGQGTGIITFVGRISPYKGVDLFVEAADRVRKRLKNQKFVVAGKTAPGYSPDFLHGENTYIEVVNKFLENEELVDIITHSELIVCPYRDATQSGVVMTAYALGCPVLVTNTGGLPEYVTPEMGLVSQEISAEGLATSMIEFVEGGYSKKMRSFIGQDSFKESFLAQIAGNFPKLYKRDVHESKNKDVRA